MYLTENFEPRRVLERFEDICAIPHGSGHEQALGDWVMALAENGGTRPSATPPETFWFALPPPPAARPHRPFCCRVIWTWCWRRRRGWDAT